MNLVVRQWFFGHFGRTRQLFLLQAKNANPEGKQITETAAEEPSNIKDVKEVFGKLASKCAPKDEDADDEDEDEDNEQNPPSHAQNDASDAELTGEEALQKETQRQDMEEKGITLNSIPIQDYKNMILFIKINL